MIKNWRERKKKIQEGKLADKKKGKEQRRKKIRINDETPGTIRRWTKDRIWKHSQKLTKRKKMNSVNINNMSAANTLYQIILMQLRKHPSYIFYI